MAQQHDGIDDLPDDVAARLDALNAEIERLSAQRHAYDPDLIARGGAFVVLSHDGAPRIERGFIRPEDERPAAEEEEGSTDPAADDGDGTEADASAEQDEEDGHEAKPLSDSLVRDLMAHRTLGLRLALGENPDVALLAVTHALAARTFYRGEDDGPCLDIRPNSAFLGGHADGIADTAAAQKLGDRHAAWAAEMPADVGDLWGFIVALDHDSWMALFAHCAAPTVFAVRLPWDQKPKALALADGLAQALTLDMTTCWSPTARSYFERVTKAHILAAVREAVSDEAAERTAGMKKHEMAEAAEQLLAGTGWLPALLRTPEAEPGARAETTRASNTRTLLNSTTWPGLQSGPGFFRIQRHRSLYTSKGKCARLQTKGRSVPIAVIRRLSRALRTGPPPALRRFPKADLGQGPVSPLLPFEHR